MICIGFDEITFTNDKTIKESIHNVFKKILKPKNLKNESKETKINNLILEYQKTRSDHVFNEIYYMYKPLIDNISRSKSTIDINYSSELNLALYNAVLNFKVDNKTNAKFNTFFLRCAKNQINVINSGLNAKKRQSNKNAISIQQNNSTNGSKEALLSDILEDVKTENIFNDVEFNMILNSMLSKLRKDERDAIILLLKGYTLKEIGEYLGNITAPAVFTKLRRLQNNKNIKTELMSLLGY